MANKQIKTLNFSLAEKGSALSSIFYRKDKKNSDISKLRNLLSNEKTRLLYITKSKQPESIYHLAKLLGRDFKAVRHDIKVLEELGFIELISSHKKGRERLRPVVDVDKIIINIELG